jgi:aryl-alcohol dehydrogenase-like predicted oxidoreductase
MKYRQLGASSVNVSEVALGAWAIGGWLWGGTDDAKAIAGIQRAVDLGMTTIDTAPVYGFGHSEEIVGRAIRGRREKVQILTKFGLRWDLAGAGKEHFNSEDLQGRPVHIRQYAARASVMEECDRSLKRLGTDHIDLYQQHWPDPTTPVEETMAACATLLEQGKIRAVGVSNYTPELMERAIKVVPLASDQPPYSMLRRGIEADVVPWCVKHKVGILAYSPLQNGILTGRVPMDRAFPATDLRSRSKFYLPENRRRILEFLDAVRPIAAAHGATLAQLVINWTIRRPGITAALVGVRNPAQAEENTRAAEFELTDEETRRVNEQVESLRLEL